MLTTIKKNLSNLLFLAIGVFFLFSTDAKAYLQQGLMKVGFFQPKIAILLVFSIKDGTST